MKNWLLIALAISSSAAAAEPRAFTTVAVLHDDEALSGAHDVYYRHGYCYVCGKGGSLAVIDVKDPTKPRIVGSIYDPKRIEDAETVLTMEGQPCLFLGGRDLHTVYLEFQEDRKIRPSVMATVTDRARIDRINGFVQQGRYLYAANKEGWIDVFDIASSTRVPAFFTARNVAAFDGVGKPHDIDECAGHIVVVDPAGFGRRNVPGTVAFYRTVDPAVKHLPGDQWTLAGKVSDDRLVGGNRVRGFSLSGDGGSFAIVAASISPEAIEKETRQPCLAVIDATDVKNPFVAATVPFPDTRGPNGLDVYANRIAFVAGGQTIMAVDLTDPRKPKMLAAERCPDVFHGEPGNDDGHDLWYGPGEYLFVTGQTSNTFGVLRIDDPEVRRILDLPVKQ